MNKESVIRQLRAKLKQFASQREAAEALGVSTAYLSQVLTGTAAPGASILRPLGLERVIEYRQMAEGE